MVSERGHRTTEASAIHCSPASRPSANSPETWFTLTHETFLRGESFDDDGVDHSARTARRLTRRSTANLLLGEPKKETRKNREESRVLKLSVPSIRSRLETASSNALTGIIRQSARMNTVASSSNNAFDAEPYEGQSRVFEQPYIGITSYPIKPGALKDPLNKSHTYKKMEGVHPKKSILQLWWNFKKFQSDKKTLSSVAVLHIKIENQKTEGVMAGDVDFKVSTWMGAAV
ncbi:hypothetical protein N7513_003459 [Penicillium frequentans]|nr:hypothetical protein N7513_003459 [Penicillium glabrum]